MLQLLFAQARNMKKNVKTVIIHFSIIFSAVPGGVLSYYLFGSPMYIMVILLILGLIYTLKNIDEIKKFYGIE